MRRSTFFFSRFGLAEVLKLKGFGQLSTATVWKHKRLRISFTSVCFIGYTKTITFSQVMIENCQVFYRDSRVHFQVHMGRRNGVLFERGALDQFFLRQELPQNFIHWKWDGKKKVVYFTSSVAQVVLLTLIYSGNHINDRLVIKSNEGRRKKSKLASECDKMPQVFLSS